MSQVNVYRQLQGSALCVREVLGGSKVRELKEQGRLWLKQEVAGRPCMLFSRRSDLRE